MLSQVTLLNHWAEPWLFLLRLVRSISVHCRRLLGVLGSQAIASLARYRIWDARAHGHTSLSPSRGRRHLCRVVIERGRRVSERLENLAIILVNDGPVVRFAFDPAIHISKLARRWLDESRLGELLILGQARETILRVSHL